MRAGRPEAEVGQDLLNDLGPVNKGDDPHQSPTLRAEQGIGPVDLFDLLRPAPSQGLRGRRWGNLDNSCRHWSLGLVRRFLPFPSD